MQLQIHFFWNDSTYHEKEEIKRRAAGRNAVSNRPTMFRRDGGGIAVFTAMKSHDNGGTVLSFLFFMYGWLREFDVKMFCHKQNSAMY